MDDYSIKRLERLAPFFHDYFELDKSEREWIFPALERGIKSTILLLELIEKSSLTYEEMGQEMGLHWNTCKQKLLALQRGGFPLNASESSAVCETGRPRKLTRRINKDDVVNSVKKTSVKSKK